VRNADKHDNPYPYLLSRPESLSGLFFSFFPC
jgi:hypothetical protein